MCLTPIVLLNFLVFLPYSAMMLPLLNAVMYLGIFDVDFFPRYPMHTFFPKNILFGDKLLTK